MSSVVRVHPPPQQKLKVFVARIKKKMYLCSANGLVAQLDRVPDYGSGGCGFDSRLVHTKIADGNVSYFLFPPYLPLFLVLSPESEQECAL